MRFSACFLLTVPLLTAAAACNSVQIAEEPSDSGAHDAAPDSPVVPRDGGGGGDSSLSCSGQAPLCFGSDDQSCCGNDPAGTAVCAGGEWLCGSAAAPGCNGTSCVQPQIDSGSDAGGDANVYLCSQHPITIDLGGVQLQPGGGTTFTSGFGDGTAVWSLLSNPSGGSINAASGAYQAGLVTDVTDVVKVTDGHGCWDTASILVGHVNEVVKDSGGLANFACGSVNGPYCASAQTYCFYVAQGADGDLGFTCKPLNGCTTCACLIPGFNGVCEDTGGDITVAGFAEKAGPYP